MAESFAPDATVADVAQRHDVHANLLHLWRRQARLAPGGDRRVDFLAVRVEPRKRSSGPSGGAIEIELGGAVRVRVDAAVDEAALGRVLRALGR